MVLEPIEPWRRATSPFRHARQIAWPATVSAALCSLGSPYLAYHTSKPWAGASGPCRRMPIRSATSAATRKRRDVHQSSVTGDQAARILGAETPLDRGFEQVASLGKTESSNAITLRYKLIDPARIGDEVLRQPPYGTPTAPASFFGLFRPQQWAAHVRPTA